MSFFLELQVMSLVSVLLLCSNALRVQRFAGLFSSTGVARVQTITWDSDWSRLPSAGPAPDLVICDSLPSAVAIPYLRRLFEYYGFFSMIECEALEAPVRWGLANFRGYSGKHYLGSYKDLEVAQLHELLRKAVLVKHKVASRRRDRAPVDKKPLTQSDVLQALQSHQIVPYFQPQVCLKSRRITGVETLARWSHPEHGVLGPKSFLALLDDPEHHRQLFDCLLLQGLKLQRQLSTRMPGNDLVFSYNIEACQLCDPDFARQVLQQVGAAGVPAWQVALEVTEREALVLDLPGIENISQLVKGGVRLSLDDFGTGHSSILRLAQIPFAQVKLDAGFIGNALGTKETRIIEAVVALARALDVELVAEGVESDRQRTHLRRLGVDVAQGYLFYKPMDGATLFQLLQEQGRARQAPGA
ncbi:EAL domain-containing protein [Pseudomonas sp. MPFS]|uniref:EAL domain-containing protein n=1 Tax=Pseudomonas sp. MPFS TaxID=2795724 RepID=UPI001F139472|nr:EAL domain-containing protein [Pseudomonas sp. MPFS]